MNTVNTTARLLCAFASAGITLVLFAFVDSSSEPYRSEYLAQQRAVPAADTRVAEVSVAPGVRQP